MPATITHSYFAKDLYEVLPDSISSKIDLKRTKMFANSTDSIMFYNLFSLASDFGLRKFQKTFHNNDTQKFFLNLIHLNHHFQILIYISSQNHLNLKSHFLSLDCNYCF